MSAAETTTTDEVGGGTTDRGPRLRPALVVVWAGASVERLGQVVLPPQGEKAMFGREPGSLPLIEQWPGHNKVTELLTAPTLSRRQLDIWADPRQLKVRNLGRRPLFVSERRVDDAVVTPGDTVLVEGVIAFYCTLRPDVLQAIHGDAVGSHPFGLADSLGMVGEAPAVWALRDRIFFAGPRHAHVLVTGNSGTGKELVAQAIHACSPRAGRALVARNAATIPETLLDAELFGNLPNYPNAGMPERKGLIGEADGSTLFLDEIGELPPNAQNHLLRVLDEGGEYHRLGESKRRAADFRLIGATNRPAEQLKPDVLARLALRVHVPNLNEHREDVPLLAMHLLRRTAARDSAVGRFFENWDGRSGAPRVSAGLMLALVQHTYSAHVRELEALLWRSVASSPGGSLELGPEVAAALRPDAENARAAPLASRDDLLRALEEHGWVKERVWRALGLPNRFALNRLMKKHGLSGPLVEER